MNNNSHNNGNGNGKPIPLALVGCGRISQLHLQTIQREPRVRLVAVVDVEEAAAKAAAEGFGVKAYFDTKSMLEAVAPEVVVICTPPNTHRSIAEDCLEAGSHVLCEKPLTIEVEDAEHMMAKAEERGLLLMMASKFRYVNDVVRAKGVIQSGILGDIVLFENEFCSRVSMKDRWNSKPELSGGGVLIDNGSHSVDIVRYLLGPIISLNATYGKRLQALEVEDTCRLILRCQDNTIASIDLSWSIHKENPFYIHVYGTDGMLEVGWKGSRYRQSEKLDWISFGTGYDKVQAVGSQLANFVEVIKGKAQPLITAEDAIDSVRVVRAAYRNADDHVWEKVQA